MSKEENKDKILTKIPILGYFFRKIKENRQAIEKTLDTGKETKSEIKKGSFFFGIFKVVSQRTFNLLKIKKRKKRFIKIS